MRRWDLLKRVPKETLDFLAERARVSVLDDSIMRSQYLACQEWLRYGLPRHCCVCLPTTRRSFPAAPVRLALAKEKLANELTMTLSLIMSNDICISFPVVEICACPRTALFCFGT